MAATVTVTTVTGNVRVYRKLASGRSPIVLARATGGVLRDRIRAGVHAVYGLNVWTVAIASADTAFTYEFGCDYALTLAQQAEIRAFIAGMVEMWRLSA